MPNFPNIRLPSSIEENIKDPVIRSEAESGIVQTRPRYTRLRHSWVLTWNILIYNEYLLLKNFYIEQKGGGLLFSWMHPYTKNEYLVRFNGDFKAKNSERDYWNISITLDEV